MASGVYDTRVATVLGVEKVDKVVADVVVGCVASVDAGVAKVLGVVATVGGGAV